MNDNFNGIFAQQGWQCPICKRVYSPFTQMCFYCGGKEASTTNELRTISRMDSVATLEQKLNKTI